MIETVRILIVDDAQINRELLKAMLEGENVSFAEAQDGAQAIELLKDSQTPFSLLLLDINMPGVDGFGVLEYMNASHLIAETPVIMISAENTAEIMDRAYALGAVDYIPRPFDANIVQRRVRNTLELFRKQRSMAQQLREANMRYMDTIKRMRTDIVLYIHLDLENDTYRSIEDTQRYLRHFELDGTIDNMVDNLFHMIPEPQTCERAIEMFSREGLLRAHETGQDTVALEHDFIIGDGKRLKVATTAGIVSNPISGALEAIIYSVDTSRVYVKRRMQNLLYENVFDGIGMINIRTGIFKTYSAIEDAASLAFSKRYDGRPYADCIASGAEDVILDQDREFFIENSALDNVCRELEDKESFFFIVRAKTARGKKNRYTFRYLDEVRETIILTVEDCTKSSETDTLTGGPNASGFENAVGIELAAIDIADAQLSILHMNICGFKAINDLFGRKSGDAMLRQFSKHLEASQLKPLVVARAENDQFLCLVKRKKLTDEALRGALSFSMDLAENKVVDMRVRCGVYHITGKEPSISSMCDYAAAAVETIENEFACPYAVFDAAMNESYLEHEHLLNHLDEALANGDVKPCYQPIVDAKTHELVSAEALVRWVSPELGMISPASFIPAVEKNGQISQIDLLIARSVQSLLERRHDAGKRIVPVSTNLSRMDFYDRGMMSELLDSIANATVNASYLRKELTESSYVAFAESQGEALRKLVGLGVPILLDDFGTGASSFSTVRDFDFSIIKIDMSFVRGIGTSPKGDSLLRSIVSMAHGLGLKTVAEGVETKEQLDFLADCDCDYIQGYYFSRPLPADDFERLLDMEAVDWSQV